MRSLLASSFLSLAALASPAFAGNSGEASEEADTIFVTGAKDTYRTPETSSATKTRTPILDIPQSISVVTSQQISDQNVRTIADLVHPIPGAAAGQGEGHRDQIILRGNSSTADFFIDGLRDDAQYYRGFYNIDRVEAHKGPNAMIFGCGGGGGVINRVTKNALADTYRKDHPALAGGHGLFQDQSRNQPDDDSCPDRPRCAPGSAPPVFALELL
ncbi:MAG: TonB-dependent receptor plug domain-containing protein [Novosphingobium sp.]